MARTGGKARTSTPFMTDINTLRKRAREHIMQGAITPGYTAHRETVVKLLNEALATEIVCVLRYKRHYFMAKGISSDSVKAEFLAHANEEQAHADAIADRIVQLGGEPDLNPEGLATRSHSEYVEGSSLRDMIKEDLIAERVAIESYREIITWLNGSEIGRTNGYNLQREYRIPAGTLHAGRNVQRISPYRLAVERGPRTLRHPLEGELPGSSGRRQVRARRDTDS
jgi:bacterioferritin